MTESIEQDHPPVEADFDEETYRAMAAERKHQAIEKARKEAIETGDYSILGKAMEAAEDDDSDVPYALRGLDTRYPVREPWLLHGLPTFRRWISPDDKAIYEHRLETSDALYEAGWPGAEGRLLFKEFTAWDREDWTPWRPWNTALLSTPFDVDSPMYSQRLTAAQKKARFDATMDSIAGRHEEHWFFAHPFCRECFGRERGPAIEGNYAAWLIRQRSETAYPAYEWDGVVPPMPVIPDEIAFLDDTELEERPEVGWLVDGVLPDHGTGILRARDQSFKSFMALSWALQVVVGGGKVLYCVGEGVNAFAKRRDAWLAHHNHDLSDLAGRLHYADRVPNLFTGDAAYDAVLVKARREGYDLVVIDTYARAAAGSDINSQGDQSVVTARVDEIKRAIDGTVLLVAHSQKSDTDSSGSIEIEDARDFVFSMKRKGTEGRVTFEVTKQKDGVETPRPVEYVTLVSGPSIVLVEAGEEGDTIMSEKDWIVAALTNTAALGARSVAEIRTWINSHETREKPISDSTLTSTLSRMVAQGVLTKKGTKYALTVNPAQEV